MENKVSDKEILESLKSDWENSKNSKDIARFSLDYCSHIDWLFKKAETLEKIKEVYYSDVYDVGDLLREMAKVFEGKESPTKHQRR
jgi:hypothetical protein